MKLPRNVNDGFTLVELMVVVGILALVSGIMIPSFSSYTRTQTLKQAQENFKSDLRSLQNRALTGTGADDKPDGVNPALYWGIAYTDVSPGNTSYSAYLTSATNCNATFLQNTTNLPPNISIVSSGTHCLLFSMEDGSVYENIAGTLVPTPGVTISLRHSSDTSTTKTISINAAGRISSSD